MIFIEHFDHRVTSDFCKGEEVVSVLYKQAASQPEKGIVLFKKGVVADQFVAALSTWKTKALLVSSSNRFNKDLGYVEDTPFLSIQSSVMYPTWIKGTTLIYIHASLVNQVRGQVTSDQGLLYWVNSVSKLARPIGVLSYQSPLEPLLEQLSTSDLYRFVTEHYKRRWTFLLFLNHIYFEKRIPLYAFAKAQLYKQKYLDIDVASFQAGTPVTLEAPQLQYDVAIPTMGRPHYLTDVLNDLNRQSTVPQKVIIIEQQADENLNSELGFIVKSDWNFELVHQFTHSTGACRARNEAVALSTAPWLLFLDDDIRIKTDFIARVTHFIHKTKAKCVTFACLQEGEKESQETYKQWESFGAGCSIVHRDILSKCLFDPALEHGYGEDKDYGMQVRNLGEDVMYAPQIQLRHLKAPIGGFRKPHRFAWQDEMIQPKPSPQLMYFRKKNLTPHQLRGYKTVQFFKTFGFFKTKNPLKHLKRFGKAWDESVKWAARL